VRILVCLYTLEVGGSQINALQIGAAVAQRGHEVIIYGPEGDLSHMASDLGLEFISGRRRERPAISAPIRRQIARLVGQRRIDVIHAYESIPTMDAACGAHLWSGVPLVATVMSMTVPKFLPVHVPLAVGTAEIARRERERRPRVFVLEPPIDTVVNAPVDDNRAARSRFGLGEADCAAVIVSRLVPSMKQEGILSAVRAAATIGRSHPSFRLLIVGDGELREQVQREADAANRGCHRQVVTLAGQMLDPHDAYAAADVVLGMGSSALTGMAFARPVVVQGEAGFWRLLTPQTLDTFLHQGFYGTGDGRDGAPELAGILTSLIDDRGRRQELGAFGHEVVTTRFSLQAAADRQLRIYADAMSHRPALFGRLVAVAEASAHYAWLRAERLRRVLGR
jgi:glycosyltransferase involved in cell wall biosynthesis